MSKIFLGEPPSRIKKWIDEHYSPGPGPGPEPTPTAPDGKVLYRTTAGGEWQQDDANISNGIFNGFAHMSDAVEVIIPSKDSSGNDVTSIGDSAFYKCSSLASVTIPDSVASIGYGAFHNCTGLTSVTIGNGMTSIGGAAFTSSRLTSMTIPDNVTSIGADAFYECTYVTDVYCWPNPETLEWNEDSCDDFKSDGSTVCHVKAEYLAAYQTKFNGKVNVTFVGDLA